MERVPFHDREMEISIQYHVMLIRQSNDQILMRCYIKQDNTTYRFFKRAPGDEAAFLTKHGYALKSAYLTFESHIRILLLKKCFSCHYKSYLRFILLEKTRIRLRKCLYALPLKVVSAFCPKG